MAQKVPGNPPAWPALVNISVPAKNDFKSLGARPQGLKMAGWRLGEFRVLDATYKTTHKPVRSGFLVAGGVARLAVCPCRDVVFSRTFRR